MFLILQDIKVMPYFVLNIDASPFHQWACYIFLQAILMKFYKVESILILDICGFSPVYFKIPTNAITLKLNY